MRTSRLLCVFSPLYCPQCFSLFFSFLSSFFNVYYPWRNRFSKHKGRRRRRKLCVFAVKFQIDLTRTAEEKATACFERNVLNANEHNFFFVSREKYIILVFFSFSINHQQQAANTKNLYTNLRFDELLSRLEAKPLKTMKRQENYGKK